MRLRMLLNTIFSGPQAWLHAALHHGHLAAAGIELDLTEGSGAFNAAPRTHAEDFDVGYGDVYALVETASRFPGEAPQAAFMMFNASPSCVAVRADGPITMPADLAGARLIGHASDVALRTFGAFAKATGLERGAVRIEPAEGGMADLINRTAAPGGPDGVFGYVSTMTAAMAAERADLARMRMIRFAPHLPDFYGSAVMVSRRLARDHPVIVRAMLAAFNRGLADAIADPQAGIAAVLRSNPKADPAVELLRWLTSLRVEMAHPDGFAAGFGGVDPARFARGVALHAETAGLARKPQAEEIFTDAFLPAPADRARARRV